MLNPEARRARVGLAAMARWCRKRARFFVALLVLASLTCVDENVPDWLLKATDETDAIVRKVMPIVRAAQQYVEDARAAEAGAGPSLLSGRQLALAMEAGMREFFAIVRQRDVVVHLPTAKVIVSALPVSGVIGDADVAVADDRKTSPVPLDAKTVFLALLWVFTILLPLKIGQLPPHVQAIIRDFLTTVNFALMIHWRVSDSRKR